ncbi:MAG: oligoendopeptidase F [Peptoniphilaceae bacterium]|uniref:oligoendopeptidase F n=1 Tax=Parvimonas sp. TaxID=1944660 RepID=UPI002A7665A4|nr:oligoendopeptidase F [Parvimonas sp.]MDD7764561.1 oligoendopeptidase F [Peptoniphilaceae bacterium]MDY3050539.1 oligoendopeptidase F [Parvimonas sp.]
MKRSEVDKSLTWDISDIFKTEDDFKKALVEVEEKSKEIEKVYKGKLNCYCTINTCLEDLNEIYVLVDLLANYASLDYEVDLGSKVALERLVAYENVVLPAYSRLSFVETEILENDTDIIEKAMEENHKNKRFLEILLNKKAHTLSTEVESVLSSLGGTFETPYRIYAQSKMQDISFNDVKIGEKTYPMSYNVFEGSYENDGNTEFRRTAFKEFYNSLEKYENTFASAYYSHIQHDKVMSRLRKYDNVFDYLLDGQEVTLDMYNRQCDVIMEKLAPHIRRYAKLLKRVNGLDKVTFADMKMPLDAEFQKTYSVEECKNMVIDGLSVLGEDYSKYLKNTFENRCIDYVDNEGKASGAFCATPYGVHPYILLTWSGNMSDILTVAHELGHGGHFSLCNKHQSILVKDCSTYFVEAPSTTNELIMAHYLLENAKSDREKRWIISEIISKTYYHNFVTHFLEAYYQREVYKIIDNGGAIDANTLNTIFRETMEKFFGEDVEIEEGVERTWMRQPHYYMGLYSYTYSAGLTIGTQMCLNILKDNSKANDWIEVLKAGGSKNPVDLAKMAGVDVTTDIPLLNTIEYIGKLIEEMEILTDKLDK